MIGEVRRGRHQRVGEARDQTPGESGREQRDGGQDEQCGRSGVRLVGLDLGVRLGLVSRLVLAPGGPELEEHLRAGAQHAPPRSARTTTSIAAGIQP